MDAVGLAASIATLLKLGYELVKRVKEFHDNKTPLTDVALRLPLLLQKIEDLDKHYRLNDIGIDISSSVKLAVEGCQKNIRRLLDILAAIHPVSNSSGQAKLFQHRLKTTWSAIKSVQKEKEIQKINQILQSYESTFCFFFASLDTDKMRDPRMTQHSHLIYDVPAVATDRFIGRVALLEQIQNSLEAGSKLSRYDRTAVLVGLGGQGKTQIALEYCRLAKASHSVIYLNALSPGTLQRSFERIALRLFGAPAGPTDDSGAAQIYRFLDKQNLPFLVVFDNLDRPRDFDNILRYFPSVESASVLVTTRNSSCTSLGKAVEIQSMNLDEAVELLTTRVGPRENGYDTQPHFEGYEDAKAIVRVLGGLPLAIDQAAAYMRGRSLPYSSFLDHYAKRRDLILRETPDIWRYTRQTDESEYENHLSVYTTWEMSFGQLGRDDRERDANAHILTLAAFANFTHISQVFFEAYHKWGSSSARDPLEHQDAIMLFRNVSLIGNVQFADSKISFSLHPLVAEWLRNRITPEERLRYVNEVANTLLVFSKDWLYSGVQWSFANTSEMLDHLNRLLDFIKEYGLEKDSSTALRDLMVGLCALYIWHGRLDEAEAFAKACMGTNMPEVDAAIHGILGEVYMFQGSLAAADTELGHALKLAEEVYGPKDLKTIRILSVLGFCRYTQSKFGEAELVYARAYRDRAPLLGPDHIDTLDSERMLGEVYRLQKKYDQSLPLLLHSRDVFANEYGPSHFRTATATSSLAALYRDQGRATKAQSMLEQCLETFKGGFSAQDGHVIAAKLRLGFVHEDQNHLLEALELYISAVRDTISEPQAGSASTEKSKQHASPVQQISCIRRLVHQFSYDQGILGQAVSVALATTSNPTQTLETILAVLQKHHDSIA